MLPGTDQTSDDTFGLVAFDIAHHHHAQVQVGLKAHRGFKPLCIAIVVVIFAKFIFSDPPAQA